MNLSSAPQSLNPLDIEHRERSLEELLKISLESINVFSCGQRRAIDEVMNVVMIDVSTYNFHAQMSPQFVHDRIIFEDVHEGTEKTFETSAIRQFPKSEGWNIVTVAFSTVADQLLNIERTARSAFQLPIPVDQDSTCTVFPTLLLLINFDGRIRSYGIRLLCRMDTT